MNRENKIKVAVLGASGSVGRHFLRLLHQHPFFDPVVATCSEANVGKKLNGISLNKSEHDYPNGQETEAFQNLTLEKFNSQKLIESGVKIIFSALPAEISGPIESELREKGFAVFTNSSAHRLDEDVPIIIPEVNPEHLEMVKTQQKKYRGFIVASSNCCVAGLVLSLKPLVGWGIKKVRVTTFQSISGARRESLAAADIISNLLPFIQEEEEKIARESVKILGDRLDQRIISTNLAISASCVRVPVLLGHLLVVEVEFKIPPDSAEVVKTFHHHSALHHLDLPTAPRSPIILRSEPDRPQPALDVWAGEPPRARGMAISLGRFRLQNNSLRFFVLVNNLVRGAAGNCLLAAELAYALGYFN